MKFGLALWLLVPVAAEARPCKHGMIRRVSLGVCVGAHSRLARGFYHPGHHRFLRRPSYGKHKGHRPVIEEPDDTPDEAQAPAWRKFQGKAVEDPPEQVERADKSSKLTTETPYELPMGIEGSVLMRKPRANTFDQLEPPR